MLLINTVNENVRPPIFSLKIYKYSSPFARSRNRQGLLINVWSAELSKKSKYLSMIRNVYLKSPKHRVQLRLALVKTRWYTKVTCQKSVHVLTLQDWMRFFKNSSIINRYGNLWWSGRHLKGTKVQMITKMAEGNVLWYLHRAREFPYPIMLT